jgi:hypothetical protein
MKKHIELPCLFLVIPLSAGLWILMLTRWIL